MSSAFRRAEDRTSPAKITDRNTYLGIYLDCTMHVCSRRDTESLHVWSCTALFQTEAASAAVLVFFSPRVYAVLRPQVRGVSIARRRRGWSVIHAALHTCLAIDPACSRNRFKRHPWRQASAAACARPFSIYLLRDTTTANEKEIPRTSLHDAARVTTEHLDARELVHHLLICASLPGRWSLVYHTAYLHSTTSVDWVVCLDIGIHSRAIGS
ncbi:hypothetical protein GGS24DRAFT_296311 [Hypoxylon argillaceum]|nr:hypothetical protein GGS24DRAFT_296311 [Hypoxylon argillaceum]